MRTRCFGGSSLPSNRFRNDIGLPQVQRKSIRWTMVPGSQLALFGLLALLHAEGNPDRLGIGPFVDGFEVVHLERPPDLITGDVLENVEGEQVVGAGTPRLAGSERPSRLQLIDRD